MSKEQRIIQLAENLAQEFPSARGGGDVAKAFDEFETPFIVDDFGDEYEGLLRFENNQFQAFVNSGHPRAANSNRLNFTAAHELGHYTIPEHNSAIRNGFACHKSVSGFHSNEKIEHEADMFASHFLMPEKKLRKFSKTKNWGAQEIISAAKKFETSITCAALRCQESLDGNSILLKWGSDGVSWKRRDREWYFNMRRSTIQNIDEVLVGTATYELLHANERPAEGFIVKGTTKAAWVRSIGHTQDNNDMWMESAIDLGSYGVLTLLTPLN